MRCRRLSGDREQEIGGCCEGHFAFRLVADDTEPVRQRRPQGRLCQEPALPAAGLADNDGSGNVPRRSGAGDFAKLGELGPPAHERAHVPKRTTGSGSLGSAGAFTDRHRT